MDQITLEERMAKSSVKSSFSHESVINELKTIAQMLSDGRLSLSDDIRNKAHHFKQADCTLWAAYLLRATSILELLSQKD